MLKLDGQTAVQRTFGRSFWTIFLFFAVFIGLADVLHAQITAENPLKFKVAPEPANSSKIDIPNPIKTEWKYNPKENRYEGYRQIGSLSYPTGEILSVNEYFKKIAQTADQQYFREKQYNRFFHGWNYRFNQRGIKQSCNLENFWRRWR